MTDESLTTSIRRRVLAVAACPHCHQAMPGQSHREIAEAMGIPHTVLWRFLRGSDITGRNLDKVHAWLSRNEAERPKPALAQPAGPWQLDLPGDPCTCGHRRDEHIDRDADDAVGWPCLMCRSKRCSGFAAADDPRVAKP